LRRVLRERRDALAAALAVDLTLPGGGMNLWVPLPPGTDDRDVAVRAAAAGVAVSAGRAFFAAEAPGPYLRLTFAAEPPERLAEGAARLAELLAG
jgi:DNA-binding transcriptional MocR family regulator